MSRPIKNVAYNVGLSLFKNDGTLVANPGIITAKISKDFGDYANVTTATEEDITYGQLKLALTATEMNADVVSLYVTDDTAGTVPWSATIYTEEANLAADVLALGGVAQSATDLKDFADTGYNPATHKVAGVVLADTVTTLTNANPSTADIKTAMEAAGGMLAILSKHAKNLLSQVDNLDGTITVTLYDDDSVTPLLTWTYHTPTATRDKAVE